MSIYEFITSKGVLTDAHRQDLKTKRGFTDETIKRGRFFSGGQYLLALEHELTQQFKQEDLIAAGVFLKKGSSVHMDPILLDDRIIIPYLDKDGLATLIRPHKLGLKNIPVQIYQPLNIRDFPEDHVSHGTLIITEGEFKAMAGWQMGASCIALPGISSFSGQHYPVLVKFLNDHKIKRNCIIFDNEVKDNPKFPNYKPDVNDRYDTQYYSFIMAKMLTKDGFDTTIGTLPDSWRVSGKIDIDGALAQGKTKEDLNAVAQRSQSAKVFFDELSDDAKEVVRKKEAKRYFRTHIRVDFGRYIAKRSNGKREWDEEISNFTLQIVATHKTSEGIIRELRFKNAHGRSTSFLAIGPEDMSGNDGFSTFCMRHGTYIWKGRKEDLYAIWEYEFLNDSGRHIIEPDCVGWQPEDKLWLFGNVAFAPDGELRPDDNGIFWTEKSGYKPVPLGITSGKNIISEGIPYLSLAPCDILLIRKKLSESIGEFEALVCMGWAFSVLMMEEIFRNYNCFPFLFITGRRRSGKSTVAEWIMNFFGMENSGKQAGDTTSVAIQRYMSYYSSLPLFIDEYRNDIKVTQKNGLFRNAYNRQSAGKGVKLDFGIREAKVRGTLILAGEETPADNALLTRCIVVKVSENIRTVNNFDWFTAHRSKLSAFAYEILSKRPEYLKKFMATMTEDKNDLATMVNDDRMAINMAVVSAGVFCMFGDDAVFNKNFIKEAKTVKEDQEAENIVSSFFLDLKAMAMDRSQQMDKLWDVKDGKIYLYFHALYNKWAIDTQRRNKEAPFKPDAIRGYLKDEPGFIEAGATFRIKGVVCKCVVFSQADAPDFIRDLVDVTVEAVTPGQTVTTAVTPERVDVS